MPSGSPPTANVAWLFTTSSQSESNYLMQGCARLGCGASRAQQHAFDARALHAKPIPAGVLLLQQDVTAVVAAHSLQKGQAVSCGVARQFKLGEARLP